MPSKKSGNILLKNLKIINMQLKWIVFNFLSEPFLLKFSRSMPGMKRYTFLYSNLAYFTVELKKICTSVKDVVCVVLVFGSGFKNISRNILHKNISSSIERKRKLELWQALSNQWMLTNQWILWKHETFYR